MPRTGRPPQPLALKIAKGERRPCRLNRDEPKVADVDQGTEPPKSLKGVGLREWLRQFPLLSESGALKKTDLTALERYCQAHADEVAAQEDEAHLRRLLARLEQQDEVDAAAVLGLWKGIDSASRRVVTLRQQANTLARELGLTPSSRATIKVPVTKPAEKKDDKLSRYLSAIPGGRA